MAKSATVELTGPDGPISFPLAQAEGIFAIQTRAGLSDYALTDSAYELVNDALRRKGAGTADKPQEPNRQG